MRVLVDSLKRLYESGKITKTQLNTRLKKGIISQEEYNYIINEENK